MGFVGGMGRAMTSSSQGHSSDLPFEEELFDLVVVERLILPLSVEAPVGPALQYDQCDAEGDEESFDEDVEGVRMEEVQPPRFILGGEGAQCCC